MTTTSTTSATPEFEIVLAWRRQNVIDGGIALTDWPRYRRQHSFGLANHNQPQRAWIRFA